MHTLRRILQELRNRAGPEKLEEVKHTLLVTGIGVAIFLFIMHCASAGELRKVQLDFSILDDDNPARIAETIEKSTSATFLVTGIEGREDDWEIAGKFPGHKDIRVIAYVSRKSAAKVDIGDLITVRGTIAYSNQVYGTYITVGSPYTMFPISFKAKIEDIVKN